MSLNGHDLLLPGSMLSRYAALADRHRRVGAERILAEVAGALSGGAGRQTSRYLLLPDEVVLYVLPLLKRLATGGDVALVFLARGAEPAYRALLEVMRAFGRPEPRERVLLLPLVRGRSGPRCLAPSAIGILTPQERQRELTREQWAELHRSIPGGDRGLDRWLAEQFGLDGGLRALQRRRATLGEVLPLIVDWGLDERFLDFYARARDLRFADHLDLDEIDRFDQVPVEVMSARLIRKLSESTPLRDGEAEAILKAGQALAGPASTVGHVDQDLLLHYQRVAALATQAGRLRHSLEHRARAAVGVLVRGTRVAKRLRGKRVICVDHGLFTGSALLLAGLLIMAIQGRSARPVGTHVIAAHTPWAARTLTDCGLVDQVSTDRLWFQEDLNEFYSGFYYLDGPVRRFVSFETARRILEFRLGGSTGDGETATVRTMLCAGIDELIDRAGTLAFVERLRNLRHDPRTVQREIVKLHLRRRVADPFSVALQELITYDSLTSFHTFGDELAKKVLLRDRLRAVDQELSSVGVPRGLIELDARCRDWDQLGHVRRWCVLERERVEAYARAADALACGRLRGGVLEYLAGRRPFGDVVDAFYEWAAKSLESPPDP